MLEHSELDFPTTQNYCEGKRIIQGIFDPVAKRSEHGVGQEN